MKLPIVNVRVSRLVLAAGLGLVALIVVAILLIGGGDDSGGGSGRIDATGTIDQYAGPTPLTVRLSASSKNADGDVLYRWRFDDGTASTEAEVTHTFRRAGYYQVILDARDESGDNDRETFLFGVWPPTQWNKAQRTPLTKKGALQAQEVQTERTEERRRELREVLQRRAREQIQG
jgi:hypothetical protein